MNNQHLAKICILLMIVNVTAAEKRKFLKTTDFTSSMDGPRRANCEQFGESKCFNSDSIMYLNCACTTNSANFHNDSIDALKKSGARFYKLPITWQSIIPYGRTNYVDKFAVKYYNTVIEKILKNGIVPLAMIAVSDFPPFPANNEETIDYIDDYARFLFGTFGSRIKYWLAIEEHCSKEKVNSNMDNSIEFSKWKRKMTQTNSRVCHIYEKEFTDFQKEQFCLACDCNPEAKELQNRREETITADCADVLLSPNYLNTTLETASGWSSLQNYLDLDLHNTCDLKITCQYTKLCALVNGVLSTNRRFPEDFILGSATAAYQIEGGWNADGKGESTWDYYLHKYPNTVEDGTNGDVAADSYNQYERDVELLKEMGATSYRFSVSWSRILPNGTADYVNHNGIAYYEDLINELLENDIIPMVTIYHWDLPISISNQGGWLNEKTVDYYVDYARVVFAAFGDRVKHWITINEPFIHCTFSYGSGLHPPLIKSPGKGYYECGRHLLLAHARAYHLYNEEFRSLQRGKVGISLDFQWPIAASDSKDDIEAAKDYLAFYFGQYADPIFKGNYPRRLVDRVAEVSASQGYHSSRLRPFTEEQRALIKGTADFLGINHYASTLVYRNESVLGMYDTPSFDEDSDLAVFSHPSWPISALPVMTEYAPGFYDLLIYLKNTYDNPVLYVTENGFPLTIDDGLNDDMKVHYLRNYLDALLDAKAAGCNIQGYFFWSLLDTFEWTSGYTLRFALHQVDINDPERPRTPRKSALVYKEIIRTRIVDHAYNPDPYNNPEPVAPSGACL